MRVVLINDFWRYGIRRCYNEFWRIKYVVFLSKRLIGCIKNKLNPIKKISRHTIKDLGKWSCSHKFIHAYSWACSSKDHLQMNSSKPWLLRHSLRFSIKRMFQLCWRHCTALKFCSNLTLTKFWKFSKSARNKINLHFWCSKKNPC